jgi:hypothetical protein
MKRFIEAADRSQSTLLPECLEDWVGDDNPVRAIDVFVDGLDLAALGFDGVEPSAMRVFPAGDLAELGSGPLSSLLDGHRSEAADHAALLLAAESVGDTEADATGEGHLDAEAGELVVG